MGSLLPYTQDRTHPHQKEEEGTWEARCPRPKTANIHIRKKGRCISGVTQLGPGLGARLLPQHGAWHFT